MKVRIKVRIKVRVREHKPEGYVVPRSASLVIDI